MDAAATAVHAHHAQFWHAMSRGWPPMPVNVQGASMPYAGGELSVFGPPPVGSPSPVIPGVSVHGDHPPVHVQTATPIIAGGVSVYTPPPAQATTPVTAPGNKSGQQIFAIRRIINCVLGEYPEKSPGEIAPVLDNKEMEAVTLILTSVYGWDEGDVEKRTLEEIEFALQVAEESGRVWT